MVVALLSAVLGGAITWLPLFLFFPVAVVGAGRLAGRGVYSRLAAGTLYAVNPFVFNRIYVGHFALLIGYAFLPFAVSAALRSIRAPLDRWLVPSLWWAVLTALSPHFAWIYGVVVVGIAVTSITSCSQQFWRITGWLLVVVSGFTLMSSYIFLPHTVTSLPTQVGRVSLALYRTVGDPHLGLMVNVLSLYGFWRKGPGPELPKDVISGWPFLMFAIVLLVAYGIWRRPRASKSEYHDVIRNDDADGADPQTRQGFRHWGRGSTVESSNEEKRLSHLLLFMGVVGFFLALGDQGPTGSLFTWAYDHVPFFAIMREPQKFLMLLALAYAVFFGWGVELFSKAYGSLSRNRTAAVALTLGIALPLSYTPTIFDGLAGQITTSPLPSSYQRADLLMGTGAGNILYLPWHLYMSYPFTHGRVVNNVAPSSFRRDVISGDNVEAGDVETQSTSPRSKYLERLFADGKNLKTFGELVAPLGVQYVVLAKTVDWASYRWITKQSDLHLVLDTPSLEVWRNTSYRGVGDVADSLTRVKGFDEVLQLAREDRLATSVVAPSSSPDGSSATRDKSSVSSAVTTVQGDSVRELSPVAYQISSGSAGWVSVDAPYQRGWSLNGRAARSSVEGTVIVRVGNKGGVLRFTPWGRVRLGYLLSLVSFVGFILIVMLASRMDTRRKMRPRQLRTRGR
ncbi:MAG: hypothetical protein WAN30_05975 [Acidimicrobiales bacterium]